MRGVLIPFLLLVTTILTLEGKKHRKERSWGLGRQPQPLTKRTLPSFLGKRRNMGLVRGLGPMRLPSPFHKSAKAKRGQGEAQFWPIEDCMTVSSGEEASWQYRSDGRTETCGLYLVGKPNQLVEVTVHSVEVDCDDGMVVVFDGWELNGNVFPSNEDHELGLKERSVELCDGRGGGQVFTSSQNAALVSFSIPRPSQGFRLSVRYLENRDPCNILMSEMSGLFTLSNEGRNRNCSLTTLLFPASFQLLNLAVGDSEPVFDQAGRQRRALGSGLSSSCHRDFVQLGGSSELDSSHLSNSQSLCGRETARLDKGLTVLCGSSTVRLVSSGQFHNSVTLIVKAATEEDLSYDTNMVITCPEFLA